jgi:hypothetical protein
MSLRRILLFSLLITKCSLGQDEVNDSLVKSEFLSKVELMVDSLALGDSTEAQFYEIYNAYGETMRDAYENRTTWIGLNHIYQWAVRERDTRMREILNDPQFYYFKKRQKEIEREARDNR